MGIKLYTDWNYLLHRIALLYGKVCFEVITKHYTLQPQEEIKIDFNNQTMFIDSVDNWLQIKSFNGEFNPSDSELDINVTEHTGNTIIKNLQSLSSGISGNISIIVITIKK